MLKASIFLTKKSNININNCNSSNIIHEATVSKISEDNILYLMSRGIARESAIQLIILGVVFVVLLIFVNKMLDSSSLDKNNNIDNVNENVSFENNINTEVISSSNENKNEIENEIKLIENSDVTKYYKLLYKQNFYKFF